MEDFNYLEIVPFGIFSLEKKPFSFIQFFGYFYLSELSFREIKVELITP